MNLAKRLAIIAGSGSLPMAICSQVRAQGSEVLVLAHRGETSPEIEQVASRVIWVRLGQLGKILRELKRNHCQQAVFAGGVSRSRLFASFRPDFTGLLFAAKLTRRGDDSVLRALAHEVERVGVEVVGAKDILPQWLPKEGKLSARELNAKETRDAGVAFRVARAIGALDVGQAVVVADGIVVAVEAIEGTDAALRRAGVLTQGKGGVVVKLCKPGQEERIDLPTVGVTTIQTMQETALTALVIEAERSLIIDPGAVVEAADRAGIAILAVSDKTLFSDRN